MKATQTQEYDPRAVAAYTYAEAARILDMPRSTLTSWKKGQDYTSQSRGRVVFEEPIATKFDKGLSYYDLVEAFVLRSLRTEYGYKLNHIRKALQIAQEQYKIQRLFLHRAFRHDGGNEFFLKNLSELVTIDPSHQMAMEVVFRDYLKRIQYGQDGRSESFYPVIRNVGPRARELVIVNPSVSFGRPIIERRGVRTSVIAMRLNAGEDRRHIIEDFRLYSDEFDQAVLLESA